MKMNIKGTLPLTTVPKIVEKRMLSLGFNKLQRPTNADGEPLEPRLPADITVISDYALGKLFGEFALMAQYTQMVNASISIKAAVAKKREKMTRARTLLANTGTVTEKDAKIEVDEEYQKASFMVLVEDSTSTMSAAMLEVYLIGQSACSREMTRRTWPKDQQHGR